MKSQWVVVIAVVIFCGFSWGRTSNQTTKSVQENSKDESTQVQKTSSVVSTESPSPVLTPSNEQTLPSTEGTSPDQSSNQRAESMKRLAEALKRMAEIRKQQSNSPSAG
jgi:hypothetical protein